VNEDRTPASSLEGLKLDGGWQVLRRLPRSSSDSTALFSETYVVRDRDGREAFLKALDFSRAFALPNAIDVIKDMTSAYVFERDLLDYCRDRRLRRVVMPVGHGTVRAPGSWQYPDVSYIILELADCDARHYRSRMEALDLAWALRTLHHVATALQELHWIGVNHLDGKPSNVLIFNARDSRLGDLGRASRQGYVAPHEHHLIAGDRTYAPPELLYGDPILEVPVRRRATDMYGLGGLLMYMFAGVGPTAVLSSELDPAHHWSNWGGSYIEVLPYVRDAFDRVALLFQDCVPAGISEDLQAIFRQLCEPDPRLRGDQHERESTLSRYSTQRYVSRLNLLARRAEMKVAV
jgi:serine/threonine protein kinase